ncbi:MAG: hypothetical protein IPH04_19765 [Saprospirales bacterium]|nr:hypothetical protein [Saprospirales bacterium]
MQKELGERGGLLSNEAIAKAKQSAASMRAIERMTDADIAEVKISASTFAEVSEATKPLIFFPEPLSALRWLAEGKDKEETRQNKIAINGWLDGQYGDPVNIAEGKPRYWIIRKTPAIFQPLLEKSKGPSLQNKTS